MKKYRQLIRELPSKKVVFAFGRFQPPGKNHGLVFAAVKHLATAQGADHIIYASRSQDKKSNPLSVDRKVYWLNRMFPKTNFVGADDSIRTFIEAAKHLNKKYKNLVMVAGSDRVSEFQTLLDKYNGKEFNFDTIEVVSAGERDPDSEGTSGMSGTKMRDAAKNSDVKSFKKGLPSTVTTIDAKRLMNELREYMGLEVVKEDVSFDRNELREQYLRGEVFLKGEFVQDDAGTYEIVDRGTNYLTVVNESGELLKKWIHMVHTVEVIAEDIPIGYAPKEITFKGYTTKNLHHSPDATKAFQATIEKLDKGLVKDPVAVLNALKATDTYMKVNDTHLAQGKSPDETELASWNTAHTKAKDSLERTGEYQHHMDYWKQHENELQGMLANYTPATAGADMNDSYNPTGDLIIEMKFNTNDRIKVARVIATALGITDVDKMSNPAQLVNNGLRKIRNKPMRPEYVDVIHHMLQTATEAGIEFDPKLVPNKVSAEDPVVEGWGAGSQREAHEREVAAQAALLKRHESSPENTTTIKALLKTHSAFGAAEHLRKKLKTEEVHESAAHKLVATKLKNIQSLKDFSANTVRPKVQTFVAREFQKDKKEVAEGKCGTAKKKMEEEASQDSRGFVRGEVIKAKDGSYFSTSKAGSRKQFDNEKDAKKHAAAGNRDVAEEVELEEASIETQKLKMALDKHIGDAVSAKSRGDDKSAHRHQIQIDKIKTKMGQKGENPFEEVELDEDAKQTHRITVTISDPNHTMVSKRKETIMKKATVKATDPHSAVERAKQHYTKAGYKVHDVIHAGLKESIEHGVSEYNLLLKARKFKKDGSMSDDKQTIVFKHNNGAEIHVNKHGEWKHLPHGYSKDADDGFEGSQSSTLKNHLDRVVKEDINSVGMTGQERKLLTLNPNADSKSTELPSSITKAKAKAKIKSITPDAKVNDSDIEADAIQTAEPEAVMGMHMVSPYASNSLRKMKIMYATHSEAFDPFSNDGTKNNIIDEEDDAHLDNIDDAELDKMAQEVNHEDDILDAYDDHELGIIDDETGEEIEKDVKEELEIMNEVLSRSERLKAKVRFARSSSKRARKTKLALKSRSSAATLNSRARKLAVNLLKKRIARKPLDKLTLGEKERIEKIISKKKVLVNRLAMRLVSRVKKIETDRLSHKKYTK